MSKGATAYLAQLQGSLPPGNAWTRSLTARMTSYLSAAAVSLAAMDARAGVLLDEADPRTTTEMLPDWERVAGLPDPCAGAVVDQTLEGRRTRLIGKLTQVGGQSIDYLTAQALAMGYAVTIDEPRPMTCEDPCDGTLYGEDWMFVFVVGAPETTIEAATCESTCEDALRTWGNDVLECVIDRLKPAHTLAIFTYGA